jgi:DNA-binding transcriptional ArsR family regulator
MNVPARPLDRPTATEYATWFKALADPTRIQIVSLLARHGEPMNVGEIVAAVDVVQSTVSKHLKVLAEVRAGRAPGHRDLLPDQRRVR